MKKLVRMAGVIAMMAMAVECLAASLCGGYFTIVGLMNPNAHNPATVLFSVPVIVIALAMLIFILKRLRVWMANPPPSEPDNAP